MRFEEFKSIEFTINNEMIICMNTLVHGLQVQLNYAQDYSKTALNM